MRRPIGAKVRGNIKCRTVDFVLVGARAEGPAAQVIAQRAARVAVVDFDTLASGEEEPVAGQNARAIGGGLPISRARKSALFP
jgi:hypothetical protein